MTSIKIEHVLDELGYDVDTWSSFSDIPLLTMLQDTNILIHPENMRLRFNTDEDLIEISYGTQTSVISEYVVSGLIVSEAYPSTISSGVMYINNVKITVPTISGVTFGNNKIVFVDLPVSKIPVITEYDSATYANEIPVLASGSIRLAKVTTEALGDGVEGFELTYDEGISTLYIASGIVHMSGTSVEVPAETFVYTSGAVAVTYVTIEATGNITYYEYDMGEAHDPFPETIMTLWIVGHNSSGSTITSLVDERVEVTGTGITEIIDLRTIDADADGVLFTSHFGETEDYTPDSFVDFAEICGIITSSYRSPYGTYYTKYFGYPTKM